MRRLNGGDIQFIYTETEQRHCHTLKVLVFDRADLPDDYSVATTRSVIEERLGALEPLRWVLRMVPGRLYHPVWLDGGPVDLDHHVRAATLDSPGDDRALSAMVSRFISEQLPRDRPLWELLVIDGLAGDRVALAFKLHHAVADGTAALTLIERLLDAEPSGPPAGHVWPAVPEPEPEPTASRLVTTAARDLGGLVAHFPRMVGRLGRAAAIGVNRKRAGGPQPAGAFTCTPTRFNSPAGPDRVWAWTEVEFDQVKTVRQGLGGTVNDVFLSMVSTALRSYLDDRGELPDQPLSAAVPVTIRHEVADTPWGNFPSNYFVTLATDVADPVERHRAVCASQSAAKAWHDTRDHEMMFEWMGAYPFWAAYSRGLPKVAKRVIGRPSFTLIASNVKGPEQPLHHCGAPMVALHSMGPLFQELNLNITSWTYRGRMSVSVQACRDHVDDIWDLVDRFPAALELLVERAEAG